MKKINYFLINIFTSFFYAGYFPFGPGTFASFLTCAILFFMPSIQVSYSLIILLIIFGGGVWASGYIERVKGLHDPSEIVIDEVIGMWISLIFVPKKLILYIIAFLLFRFFDILKPFPINCLEELPRGWGVILDDVLAGIFSFLIMRFLLTFLPLNLILN